MSIAKFRCLVFIACLTSCMIGHSAEPIVLVVMDPLSKPLSCDCVRGYAQREYTLLADHLESTLKRDVEVVWFESLAEALDETNGRADLVIGKHSVVLADVKATSHPMRPIAQLTGKDGEVTQKGLIVVRRDDPAADLKGLRGYRILLGPTDAEEKSSAAEQTLAEAGIPLAKKRERFGACSEAAMALMELPSEVDAAAVISSYAEPLLAGCGAIKKGDLRVIGETRPVPFVTAFVSQELSDRMQEQILLALIGAGVNPQVLTGLETLAGFVPWSDTDSEKAPNQTLKVKKKESGRSGIVRESLAANSWPQFRGPNRDGVVAWLPDQLPNSRSDLLWTAVLPGDGVGGLTLAEERVIVSGRDASDSADQFVAFDFRTGKKQWTYQYRAPAALDYGNSPRATPAFVDGVLVTLGATGILSGLDVETGVALWSIDLSQRFDAEIPTWGFSASPLIVDGNVYLQVGEASSLVAIDLYSGKTKRQISGPATAYASMMPIQRDDETLLIGVDMEGYFARRLSDGSRCWSHQPELSGDFGVPTPIVVRGGLVFVGENNGVQLFRRRGPGFGDRPVAIDDTLIPDSHTPVAVDNKLLVASAGLHCLSIDNGLSRQWSAGESLITGYAALVASHDRAVVTTEDAKLLLFDIRSQGELLDQTRLTPNKMRILSHPAVVGDRMLIRVGTELRCYRLRR